MATQEKIRSAYIELAVEHSDSPGTKFGEVLFEKVECASEVLGDPEKRRAYDELRNSEAPNATACRYPPVSETNASLG